MLISIPQKMVIICISYVESDKQILNFKFQKYLLLFIKIKSNF